MSDDIYYIATTAAAIGSGVVILQCLLLSFVVVGTGLFKRPEQERANAYWQRYYVGLAIESVIVVILLPIVLIWKNNTLIAIWIGLFVSVALSWVAISIAKRKSIHGASTTTCNAEMNEENER